MKYVFLLSIIQKVMTIYVMPRKKNRKAYQGSLQVSSTNESGVRALALPLTWVLLGTCRQREESPASALP